MARRHGGRTYVHVQVRMGIYNIYDPLDKSGQIDKGSGRNVPS